MNEAQTDPGVAVALAYYGSRRKLANVLGITEQGVGKKVREGLPLTQEQAWLVHKDARIPLRLLSPWLADVVQSASET